LKAKIIGLHSVQRHGILLDSGDPDRIVGEELSIHLFIHAIKRQKARTVTQIYDQEGTLHTSSADILRSFAAYMRQKYDHIPIDDESIRRMVDCGTKKILTAAHVALEEPITKDELLHAIRKGKTNKAPGRDGICLAFFTRTWDLTKRDMLTLMNNLYIDGILTNNQKHGILVCIPKTAHPTRIEEYRPLTLLNTDYKLLARIIANRLRPWIPHVLQPIQFCGLQENTVFEAVITVRDAVAYVNTTRTPLCAVTIVFKEAFDKISHSYLFAILKEYGFSEQFQQRIRRMYDNATSTIQINGHRSGPIPIRSSVRQGCPMSMLLYALCLNPLLCTLENKLTGLRIERRGPKTAVVAYADDVTLFVTSPDDVTVMQDALRCYEAASGTKVNIGKSKAIAIGPWDTSVRIMDIPYYTETRILGFHLMTTVNASAIRSWSKMTDRIRAQARDAFNRELSLDKRIQHVHDYLMAKVW